MLEYLMQHDGVVIALASAITMMMGYVLKKIVALDKYIEKTDKHSEVIEHLDSEVTKLERSIIVITGDMKVVNTNLETLKVMFKEFNAKIELLQSSMMVFKIGSLNKE